jgi:2,4-dienoyl-CoA reductase-like NADH-dependent reductase (Old Yellow Enzyme family)/NADPH-dependent 2,4-dienoyl-CoA reductase/sulfur reductase-like enzyme
MKLQQPGRIGNLLLKNRVVMAPMGTNYSTTDGLSTQRDHAYYAERALGGVAMIMTEAMVVTEQARPHNNSLCCFHDRFIPGLATLVEGVKEHDCHVFAQLNHRGGLLRRSVLNMEPVGPSPWINPNTGDAVRALTIPEIYEIQTLFVAAAKRLKIAGYDGVEIHAANGYLFQQFFTQRINQRTDQYGGSFENRARMLLETIDRIRTEISDFNLIVRLSASEFVDGGYSNSEIIELAKAVEKAGVDAIDLSGGSNESPQLSKYCIQPPSFARACLAPLAKPIKEALKIPVLVAGRIVEPADAESVIASGSADFVSVGRALYADPHWCLKAFGQVKAPIRKCIACNVCFERLTLEKDVACVQNPMVGTQFEALPFAEPFLFPSSLEHPKRILVIGAGVAGLEAARVAKGLGHEVEVWEKQDHVGGQLKYAVAAPDKEEVRAVWDYRWQEIEALKVPVHTNIELTVEKIKAYGPDRVIVATGAIKQNLPLDVGKVDEQILVLHAWDAFDQVEKISENSTVTIIGGGMVGMELADLLRLKNCRIRILEMQASVANGMARNNKFELIERLQDSGATILTKCRIDRIEGREIIYQGPDGATTALEIGSALVFATGPKPNLAVLDVVQASQVPYELIGDCARPGDYLGAIRDGWMVALGLDRIE